MIPSISSFPWLSTAFPWRPPIETTNGWHQLIANGLLDMKKETIDSSPLSATTSDGTIDGTDCVVCGDKSSGKHYGQFSCEGCKSFFKRSIRRSLSYTCRASKNCAIDVQHRNQCQYCRLKKCIRMGMRKEAVQRGRLPVSIPSFIPSNIPSFFRPFPFNPLNNPLLTSSTSIPLQVQKSTKDSIFEFAAQTIFATVNWARTSMANLPKCDQIMLLRHSWAPIFIFALAHSNFSINVQTHLMDGLNNMKSEEESTDKDIDNDKDKTMIKTEKDDNDVRELQNKLDCIQEYSLDMVEISSLRAILLFCCHDEELKEKQKTADIVEKLNEALREYCKNNKQNERYTCLKECLLLIRTTSSAPISRLFFSRLVGLTPIESIISDLLNIPQLPSPFPLFPPSFFNRS